MRFTLATSDLFTELAPWLGGLVVVAVIGGVIMLAARNYLTNKSYDTTSAGFTLADLRALKASGEIDQAEFDRLKLAMFKSTEITGLGAGLSSVTQTSSTTKPTTKRTTRKAPPPTS